MDALMRKVMLGLAVVATGCAASAGSAGPAPESTYTATPTAHYDTPAAMEEAEPMAAGPAPAQPMAAAAEPPPPPPPAAAATRSSADRAPAPSGGGGMVAGEAEAAAPAASRSGRTPPPPPPAAPIRRPVPVVQALTAASVGDVDRRGPYLDYLSRHPAEKAQINLDMSRRIRFRVLDGQSRPLHDAVISFTTGGRQVTGRTHADGYWDFFPGVSAPSANGHTKVRVQWRNQQRQVDVTIPAQGDAPEVAIQLPQASALTPANLDLGFLIDVTGSMGDELAYINAELMGIIQQVRAAVPQVNVRVGATYYRDRADFRPLEQIPFTNDVGAFLGQAARITASGGGDYPEDLNAGLEAAVTSQAWSDGPAVRVLVLISDAPPQQYPDSQYTYRHAMVDASTQGIRILPVAASGADRVVEYLFRAMGAFTSTPYVYLTDDSGIGGHHMEADTDRISVEMFSNLLTRLLIADLQGQGMHEPSHASQGGQVLRRPQL